MNVKNNQQILISNTEDHVRKIMESDETGHDWWHILRVRNLARKIAEKEGGNIFLIEMASLLHDLDDWKFQNGHKNKNTIHWLQKQKVEEVTIRSIINIIDQVSFKGAGVDTNPDTLEAKIVQDADRLDALGAIGIARAFAYGGSRGRLIFHPDIPPETHNDFESYKKNQNPTINHFYEKLLLLKDRLNTSTAKSIAKERHLFMKRFMEEFFKEWENIS